MRVKCVEERVMNERLKCGGEYKLRERECGV